MAVADWRQEGLIPLLLYFQNGNEYTGSSSAKSGNELRFKLKPEEDKLVAEVWPGPFCYEKSEITGRAEFPLTEEGRAQALEWLNRQYGA